MIYNYIIKPFFFLFDPEFIHGLSMKMLKFLFDFPLTRPLFSVFRFEKKELEKTFWKLQFKNTIGLAAGFDKNGDYIEVLSALGFGFVELGTVTPVAQDGNDKPRLFRLPNDLAIINRMGFNNKGVDYLVKRLKNLKYRNSIIVGGNIGKNKNTPNEEAVNDYRICFEKLHDFVDYFVVNVSSPNTPNLRALQDKDELHKILSTLQNHTLQKENPKPILLKIAPDLTETALEDIISIVESTQIAGIIATNTTIDRNGLTTDEATISNIGNGGLSGKPLIGKSIKVVSFLKSKQSKPFVIIGVGGIMTSDDLIKMKDAGADLFQLYTGFIYEGPFFIKKLKQKIYNSKY